MNMPTSTAFFLAVLLTGCATLDTAIAPPASSTIIDQSTLPESIQIPPQHSLVLDAPGAGQVSYRCRPKASDASQFEWGFIGPEAQLMDRGGAVIGRYFGPPTTWLHNDGSSVGGFPLRVSLNGPGNLPLQIIQAVQKQAPGVLANVSIVQRLNTEGGLAADLACGSAQVGQVQTVTFTADYLFWRAN
jgi:Protein of unknown function (DUF3455)